MLEKQLKAERGSGRDAVDLNGLSIQRLLLEEAFKSYT